MVKLDSEIIWKWGGQNGQVKSREDQECSPNGTERKSVPARGAYDIDDICKM